jgi:predicted phage baseplate assembly protein
MTLPVPALDDRTFQDIVDECKRMIPRYTPEWTDHNVSDPGVTLIELFAWMTELLLYRLNQVPTRNYIKFLEMIGVQLDPPKPASTELLFRLSASQVQSVMIPAGTEVATQRTSTEEALVFATEQPLLIGMPDLRYALISYDEASFLNHMGALLSPEAKARIFQAPPQQGNGFYLGYQGNLAGHLLRLHLRCETIESIGIDPQDPPLIWEYWDGSLDGWRPVGRERDEQGRPKDSTLGLNQDGDILVQIPSTSAPRELRGQLATWIRCRVAKLRPDQRFYAPTSEAPIILGVTTERVGATTRASHSQLINVEPLGRSDGTAGQTFKLSTPPVLPRRTGETLEVETETTGTYEAWHEVADFAASTAADAHFTLDSATGTIQLGPAIRLPNRTEYQFGRTPPVGRALRFTSYRTGGGVVGNVGRDTLSQMKSSIPYVASVTNPQAAYGGADGESLDAAMIRGPQLLRRSLRAVTEVDYEELAVESSPDIARARCIAPRMADDTQAGTIRLLLVPHVRTIDAPVTDEQLRVPTNVRNQVQLYLDERRMLNVRLILDEPTYRRVAVIIDVYKKPKVSAARLKTTVEQALYRFIHPTAGGPDGTGWHFERAALYASDIYGLVQSIPGVEHIGKVQLMVSDADGKEQPVEEGILTVPENTLFCSATHTVQVR